MPASKIGAFASKMKKRWRNIGICWLKFQWKSTFPIFPNTFLNICANSSELDTNLWIIPVVFYNDFAISKGQDFQPPPQDSTGYRGTHFRLEGAHMTAPESQLDSSVSVGRSRSARTWWLHAQIFNYLRVSCGHHLLSLPIQADADCMHAGRVCCWWTCWGSLWGTGELCGQNEGEQSRSGAAPSRAAKGGRANQGIQHPPWQPGEADRLLLGGLITLLIHIIPYLHAAFAPHILPLRSPWPSHSQHIIVRGSPLCTRGQVLDFEAREEQYLSELWAKKGPNIEIA